MPAISSQDLAIFETFPQSVRRYISVAERPVILSGQVNGTPSIDTKSKGYYQFAYDNASGVPGATKIGMSVDIGTAPGLRDIGTVRMRKDPTSVTMYIEEIAAGAVPIQDNHYFQVVREFIPSVKLPRLVGVKNNSSYVNSFTEYHDYDIAYTNQNANIAPIANITESAFSRKGVKQAGWVDVGQNYRTVSLNAFFSTAVATGATITEYQWTLGTGDSVVSGSTTSFALVARLVPGYRVIELRVRDSLGTYSYRYLPMWVHDESYPPITSFRVTSDQRDEGRTMGIELFGEDGAFDENVIPANVPICYWEDAAFGGTGIQGTGVGVEYIDSFQGWTKNESVNMKLHNRSTLSFEIEGIAARLSAMQGFAQKVSWVSPVNRWFKMTNITVDRMIHYYLREYTTALTHANLYLSGVTTTVRAEDVKKSDVWSQITELAKGYYGTVKADSSNSIWLRRHYSYMEISERTPIDIIMHLDASHWTDAEGLTVSEDYQNKVSIVTGTGSFVSNNKNRLIYSKAPGLVPAENGGEEEAPFQRTISQAKLNQLTGHHYARQNNPRSEVSIRLKGNWDFFESAWGEPITVSWMDGNIRGLQLNTEEFLITKIAVTHSNEFGTAPKIVTLTLEQATIGEPGITYTPPSSPAPPSINVPSVNFPNIDLPTYSPFEWYNVPPSVPTTAVFNHIDDDSVAERYYVLSNTADEGVQWEAKTLTGMLGTGLQFKSDPFSPLYMRTGTTVNGWYLTDDRMYYLTDIFGTVGLTSQSTHPDSFSDWDDAIFDPRNDKIWVSRLEQGFAMAIGYVYQSGDDDYQPVIMRTTDGSTWSYDDTTLPRKLLATEDVEDQVGDYRIDISPHVAGLVYLSGNEELWISEDHGATWEDVTTEHPLLATYSFRKIWHVPYAANPNSRRFYFGVSDRVMYVVIGEEPDVTIGILPPSDDWTNEYSSEYGDSGNRFYYYDTVTKTVSKLKWPGSANTYGIWYFTTCDTDPTRQVAIGKGILDNDNETVPEIPTTINFNLSYLTTSRNAGKTWSAMLLLNGSAYRINMASKVPDFLYIYGQQYSHSANASEAYLTVSKDFGKKFTDGSRNLLDFTSPKSGRITHICGSY